MPISRLPKELRLQIWANVYLSEPPRLVALETKPHDEGHDEQHLCPRYCPSPAPIAVNLCRESRAEALYQATKANHIVHLPAGLAGTSCDDFYFRVDTDILLLQLSGPRVNHYDDSPEVGLLAHFLLAAGCHATRLRRIAITNVILHGFRDGSLSNVLRSFPTLSRMVMMLTEDIGDSDAQKERFVRAAARIVRMYKLDLINHARASGEVFKAHPFDVDFAMLRCGRLDIVPKHIWRYWSDGGDEWATLDNSEPSW